jgi:A/G-specific adenine glycosylase
MTDFADRVLDWFGRHGRKDLPWQRKPTPYRVWVSEIMLQQTQVTTVIPYYERFMHAFPDVGALADAHSDDVLHHWSGLGYYARARNLHKAAKIVRDEFGGSFPVDFDAVLALPGIGRSTAGAILALSSGQRHAILDGNVKRVLSRYYAVDGWPGATAVAKTLWAHAEKNTPEAEIAAYTQAMMDLGATVCTRTKPACECCPLAHDCQARAAGRQGEFPGRRPKRDKPRRTTHMILVRHGNEVYLERRPPSGIWGGLYSFPELGSAGEASDWCREKFAAAPETQETWQVLSHSFTHFDLDIVPVAVRVHALPRRASDDGDGLWYSPGQQRQIGLAAPVSALLQLVLERQTGRRSSSGGG